MADLGAQEGNIGNDGSDKGTAGGASGNPSDSGGSSGSGGNSGSDDGGGGLGAAAVRSIISSVFGVGSLDVLKTVGRFAKAPIQFLRFRLIPLIVGGIFGFVFDLANLIATPFDSAITGLRTAGDSITLLIRSFANPVLGLFEWLFDFAASATSGLGSLQPYALLAISIVTVYVLGIIALRLLRGIADSVPGASGVETFLFG